MSSVIRKMLDSIPKILMHKIKSGEQIDGYTVVPSLSNRKWSGGFVDQLGADAAKIQEVVYLSPAKAEKVLGKKRVAELTYRDETGEKLVAGSHDFCNEFEDC